MIGVSFRVNVTLRDEGRYGLGPCRGAPISVQSGGCTHSVRRNGGGKCTRSTCGGGCNRGGGRTHSNGSPIDIED